MLHNIVGAQRHVKRFRAELDLVRCHCNWLAPYAPSIQASIALHNPAHVTRGVHGAHQLWGFHRPGQTWLGTGGRINNLFVKPG
jgi:hypothetical protein